MPEVKHLDTIQAQFRELFLKKLHDYGTKDIEELGVNGVISRMTDKFARLRNLYDLKERGDTNQLEPMEDTWMDVIGYATIGLLLERGQWAGDGKVDLSKVVQVNQYDPSFEAVLPHPKKVGDVGYDFATSERTTLPPFSVNPLPTRVPTGLRMKLPRGMWGDVRGRSSAATRGIHVVPSVIDEGYTGPIYAMAINLTPMPIVIEVGERLAQMVLHRSTVVDSVMVDELPETDRGATGFGSTGK